MQRRTILLALVGAVLLLYVAQHTSIVLYERYESDWIFTPSHYLGGLSVGLALLYAASGLRLRLPIFLCLGPVLFVGVAWEIWEYAMGFDIHLVDTLNDLLADFLGGLSAYWFVQKDNA